MRFSDGIYARRRLHYERLIAAQKKNIALIVWFRLLSFILGFGTAIYLFIFGHYIYTGVVFVTTLVIFIYLIRKHDHMRKRLRYCSNLKGINERGELRIQGQWKDFPHSGEDFIEEAHPYCYDLDIFGRNSLYQYINTAHTKEGLNILRTMLEKPLDKDKLLLERQEAVAELAIKLTFRQHFEASAEDIEGDRSSRMLLKPYEAVMEEKFIPRLLSFLLPLFTLGTGVYYLLTFAISYKVPLAFIAINICALLLGARRREALIGEIYVLKKVIYSYENMLLAFENEKFNAELLKKYQKNLRNSEEEQVSKQFKELSDIADRISDRRNMLFMVFNILTLWDYHIVYSLSRWKKKSYASFSKALEILGEIEALNSLAQLSFEHPNWCFPEFLEGAYIEGKELGHPLLGKNRVCNDFSIKAPQSAVLITGSNMSGKSTLLRTIGINLVLAYCGAPVCAEYFKCSIFKLYSCMRISDNLEKNISSFYAELLRIKSIVEAVKRGERVFFLLDEIFKGTNSFDRHYGAVALIKELIDCGAVGMVSTHDLELGELEKKSGGTVTNYHFREYYMDEKISFDYKLRKGISTTRNALYLMKLTGIDLKDEMQIKNET